MLAMNNQQGAALIVGLILMLVLTILGISGMKVSRSQIAMSGQDQFHAQAMNLAEAAVNAQIEANTFNPDVTGPTNPVTVTPAFSGQASSTVEYLNQGMAPDGGFSDDVLTYRFKIDATATTPAPGPLGLGARASVQLIQGVYILAPGQ